MSIYSLSSGDGSAQFTPPPAVKETTVFDGWQSFLSGVSDAVTSTVQTVADTAANVAQIRDEPRTATSPTPVAPSMSPIVAIALGVGLAFVLKRLMSSKAA